MFFLILNYFLKMKTRQNFTSTKFYLVYFVFMGYYSVNNGLVINREPPTLSNNLFPESKVK